MVERNRREPTTMPELIDKMATQQDLKGFAHRPNEAVPPEQRRTRHPTRSSKAPAAKVQP
jgi:hypothetical protein